MFVDRFVDRDRLLAREREPALTVRAGQGRISCVRPKGFEPLTF
ncbi:hypothetical protein Ae168Ps1_4862c [Pseudonocardia sp. Ae168_Ps1]|nr:hypothetical protein Ae150APs1_4824c [Pseudonocardia sp. Ae150A_Ps1]OLL82456.1 hypothetical protein Ae168Ps1_4862c [Pseudonocardia sp. Ae168_Ps1]OLL83429.1 hypothetical protein Ae263Ps1_0484 [Pseudonocardia sp. Ae263_Ps1]OLL90531.1 hypothetical protein Ae356Ps1_0428c [Pseudonocardia sp. Ae356_Ps1]